MGSSNAEPPLRVERADELSWDGVADVIVVGFGGAGACAAIEAAEQGAAVIIFDRYGGGGATERSGGVVYAGGTRFQREAGFDDTAEEMHKYLTHQLAVDPADGPLRAYCDGSAGDIDWLADHGVPFGSTVYEPKADYPPDGSYLYYSGNEVHDAHVARPAPRGHRTVGAGLTGRPYFHALRAAAERLGARVMANAPVTRLIQDATGAIIGVETKVTPPSLVAARERLYQKIQPLPFLVRKARKAMADIYRMEREHGETRRFRARGGVILATGGYSYNQALIREHAPVIDRNTLKIIRIGSLGDDGSGVELGMAAGGDTGLMGNMMMSQTMGPNVLRQGIFVNRRGERFIAEDAYNGEIGGTIAQQPDSLAWLIVDNRIFWRAFWDCLTCPKGTFFYLHLPALLRLVAASRMSWSLEGLARRCGIEPKPLVDSVASYNAAVDRGVDDGQGKSRKLLGKIVRRPYWAISYATSSYLSFIGLITLGGLKVADDSGEVLDRAGHAIQGLYAIGRTAVGVCSPHYISGMSLGDGVFSGRRAARHAAERALAGRNARPVPSRAI